MRLSYKLQVKLNRIEKEVRRFFQPPLFKRFFHAAWLELVAYYRQTYRRVNTRRLKRHRRNHHPVQQFAKRQVKYALLIGTIGAFSRRGYAFHTHKDKK